MSTKTAGDRQLKHRHVAFKADKVGDDGTFKGYASVFGNEDSYREIVEQGAFAESLERIKASGDPLPVLWQHNSTQPIGGSDVLAEDDRGLYTEGWLLKDVIPLAAQAHALMHRRVVRGLSIGYYVELDSWNEKTGIRTLLKLDLVEYSIVTFPANTLALIDEVKARRDLFSGGNLPSLKQFEEFLREAGFSNTQAKAIAGHGLSKLIDQREAGGGDALGDIKAALSGFSISNIMKDHQ